MYSGHRTSLGSMGMGKKGGCSIMSLSTLSCTAEKRRCILSLTVFGWWKTFSSCEQTKCCGNRVHRTEQYMKFYYMQVTGEDEADPMAFFHNREFFIMKTFLFSKAQCFHSYAVLFLTSFQIRGFSCGGWGERRSISTLDKGSWRIP